MARGLLAVACWVLAIPPGALADEDTPLTLRPRPPRPPPGPPPPPTQPPPPPNATALLQATVRARALQNQGRTAEAVAVYAEIAALHRGDPLPPRRWSAAGAEPGERRALRRFRAQRAALAEPRIAKLDRLWAARGSASFATDVSAHCEADEAAHLGSLLAGLPPPAGPFSRVLFDGSAPSNARARGSCFLASPAKLLHDAEQLTLLLERGRLPRPLWAAPLAFLSVLDSLGALEEGGTLSAEPGFSEPFLLQSAHYRQVAPYYNTHLYSPPLERQPTALNPDLDTAHIEQEYTAQEPGLVVIDDLLSPSTLAALQRFVEEATIWHDVKYGLGSYLGAYLEEGLHGPLLLQLEAELRLSFPEVIGALPLVQMWAYKYEQSAPEGIGIHADKALVNLNLWLTDDAAGAEVSAGGGLQIWKKAPAEAAWEFDDFNSNTDAAQAAMQSFVAGADSVTVPHRCNRLTMFDSQLLHRTEPGMAGRFRPGATGRRVNLTLLFGRPPERGR
eukprot:COSAG04_NODE_49_length_31209_cov_11.630248_19_plen_504_part_00